MSYLILSYGYIPLFITINNSIIHNFFINNINKNFNFFSRNSIFSLFYKVVTLIGLKCSNRMQFLCQDSDRII